ncbi:MAG: alpha/beta fold hydrolase, partial [Cyclobacteriaceae bacterium]
MRFSIWVRGALFFIVVALFPSCKDEPSEITYCPCSSWDNWNDKPDVKCGFLIVPEDHDKPMGQTIKIAFAIFKSQNQTKSEIPVIMLIGGPGGVALSSPDRWTNHESRMVGDLIVVEQRGIGRSSPLPDISETFINIIAADASSEEEKEITLKAMKDKVEEIRGMGIDLTKYNTTQNAKDVGELMRQLNYEKYDLYGMSYGTKLGIMTMKYFGSKINAAILEGPAI